MIYFTYIWLFLAAGILSFIFTLIVKKWATKWKIYDWPAPRKVHGRPTPRLGGLAFFASFFILILIFLIWRPELIRFSDWLWFSGFIDKRLFGVLLGAVILIVVGVIDDIKGLSPLTKLSWQIIAALIVIASGVGIEVIRNPFGGPLIHLDQWQIPFQLWGQTYHFVVLGDLFVLIWIVAMINVLNFLDGLDGLAAGVSFIAFLTLFSLSLAPDVGQIHIALVCIILAGALIGFLPQNFYPAKIFMGDSGSMFLGYMIAVLAVVSGGKVATSLLVLGFPILDGLWVIGRRFLAKRSPFLADKKHLHHRFLAVGLNQRQAVLAIWFLTAVFGIVALLSETREKFIALMCLLGLMVVLAVILVVVEWKKEQSKKMSN